MRAFVCIACGGASMTIAQAMELGPGDYDDERSIQLLVCSACGFEGLAMYTASRRGSDERAHHFGYASSATALVKRTLALCSVPQDRHCRCHGHELLRMCVADPKFFPEGKPIRFG